MFRPEDLKKIEHLISEISKTIGRRSFINPAKEILVRELSCLCTQKINDSSVLLAIRKMKERKTTEVEEFVKELQLLKATKKYRKCTIVIPYQNLEVAKSFYINGRQFTVIGKRKCTALLNLKAFREKINYYFILERIDQDMKYVKSFLQIESSGNSLYDAWDEIENDFAIFRGIYNWSFLKGAWTIQSFYSCRSVFHEPGWLYINFEDDKAEIGKFNLLNGRARPITDLQTGKQLLVKMLKLVRQPAPLQSTKALIYDCFRLYGQAYDANQKSNFFLALWQLVEAGCMAHSGGGSTQIIIKRLHLILSENRSFEVDLNAILKSLAQKRNQLVHKGIDDTDQKDLNILKMFAENVVAWLVAKSEKLTTRHHIEKYFEFKTTSVAIRTAVLDTVRHLNSTKEIADL